MKPKTYFSLLIISGLFVLTACSENFFDRQAGDRISPDEHYLSTIDAIVSSKGAIITLQDALPRLIMLDGLRSDMMELTGNFDPDLRELHYHEISPGNPYADPNDLYKVIVNINEILANVDRLAQNSRDFDEYITHFYKGELFAMRAWAYLKIARLFNQVAYIEDNLTSLPENLEQTILSKETVIDSSAGKSYGTVNDDDIIFFGINIGLFEILRPITLMSCYKPCSHLNTVSTEFHYLIDIFTGIDPTGSNNRDCFSRFILKRPNFFYYLRDKGFQSISRVINLFSGETKMPTG